jgi:glycosyltransferase involved in cell wall biosynthesis
MQSTNLNNTTIKNFVSGFLREKNYITEKYNDFLKISIVIPSYNKGEFLEKTLLSILNQNYPDLELIVIDGGSTDNTVGILKKYHDYIHFWVSEKDNGQSDALNKGFLKATGEIFGWQNADDIYLPNAFREINQIFQNKKIKICYGNWLAIDGGDEIISEEYSLPARKPHFPYENMDAYNQTIFWRKEVHEAIGPFDEKLSRMMDNDMIIRMLLTTERQAIYKADGFYGAFRKYTGQKTALDDFGPKDREELRYLEKKYGFPPKASLKGFYFRVHYRFFQLFYSLFYGGISYTIYKIKKDLKRKKSIL